MHLHSEKWSVINFASCISITSSDSAALYFSIFLFSSRWKSWDNCDFVLCIGKYFSGNWHEYWELCVEREGERIRDRDMEEEKFCPGRGNRRNAFFSERVNTSFCFRTEGEELISQKQEDLLVHYCRNI